jgi:hypothetical protein
MDDGENLDAIVYSADGWKRHAHAGDGTCDNQSLFACGFDGSDEVRIVPGVYLAFARDIFCVRSVLMNLRYQRAVRRLWNGGRRDDRQFTQRGHLGEGGSATAQPGIGMSPIVSNRPLW